MNYVVNAAGFHDVVRIPPIKFETADGAHQAVFARHHVIPTDVYKDSSFLKALAQEGLWDQNSFRQNGVALVQTIDGANPAFSPVRGVIAGAAHTGGHVNYSTAHKRLFDAFDEAYESNLASDRWGYSNTENGWLSAQAQKVNGFVSVLKVEFVNPNSALKLHTSDVARIDLTSAELWTGFERLYTDDRVDFHKAIVEHPAYVAGSKLYQPSYWNGGNPDPTLLDASPGSRSPLDVTTHLTASEVKAAMRDQYGISADQPSLFDKASVHDSLGLLKHSNSLVMGMAAAGIVTLILKHQDALAHSSQREVSFDEARESLGVHIDANTLKIMAASAAFDIGVSVALPVAWAKHAWDLMLSGEDVIGLVRLYGQVFPDSGTMNNLNRVADTIESSSGYRAYKDNKDYLKEWIGKQFTTSGDGLPVYRAELDGTFSKQTAPYLKDYEPPGIHPYPGPSLPPHMHIDAPEASKTYADGHGGYSGYPGFPDFHYPDRFEGDPNRTGVIPPEMMIGRDRDGNPVYVQGIDRNGDGIYEMPGFEVRPGKDWDDTSPG